MTRVAFQGVAGAYSEQACRQHFGNDIETLPCETFADIFSAVESQQAEFGMLPVENAVAGSVATSYELLMERDLLVYGEVVFHVQHMLLAPAGADRETLTRVRSHPQALAQCQRYLTRHNLEPVPDFDTAGSARDLAAKPEPGVAAIAGELAADLYGLEILDRAIEDFPFNFTRFFILANHEAPQAENSKTSILFTTPHQPGVLFDCIGEFAQRRVNLCKIESRPRLNKPWQYVFYLDCEGHSEDPACAAAIMGLLRRSSFVKLLGSYPAAETPRIDNGMSGKGKE